MSALPKQLTLLLEKHHNHYLFSDYYLDHLLPRRPDWQEATAEARAAMKRLQTIYAAFTPTENEAQTERDWIRPVLEALNHVFEVQPSVATPDGVRRPDYVFFPADEARQTAKPLQGQEDYPATALAVGDAKHWDRSLDQTLKGDGRKPRDPFTNKNPSWQIYFYMLHTGLAWGILTNGRAWRLYHKDTAHKLNYYYEVDLPALLGDGDVEAFQYFYLFFRQASFVPNGEGRTWLDIILQESRDYAEGVGEDLKDQVYEALSHVAQGFLDYPGNNLTTDPDTLKAIYDNSLVLLYRLLFILYAESRGLLPLQENETYRLSYSLDAIKKEIERTLSKPILPTSRLYWPRLEELFGAINKGNDHLGVPAYNGDLFDPQKHPFLERYAVGDQELRRAIDNLARTDTEEGRVFVDYRDLEVRHLGSIYEGLLEYQLRHAEEDLAVVKEKGRERYVSADEGREVSVPAGRVYLVTDRGERKATGSYYTPDYIVKYIVEQTLQPLLDETVVHWANSKNVTEEDLVSDILSLDVLDPAMGSGHFLVEATEYIARYLVGLGLEATVGMGAEAELDYWKRRVVQACIYGVDLNPLAVELAKLSLWLATVSRDKPLSFLDHHLRCGNSLIGARVAELGTTPVVKKRRKAEEEAAGQISMFEDDAFRQSMMIAVDSMWLIEGTDSSTVEGIREQERIYRQLREELTRRYRLLADLWTARYFGVVIEPENQEVQTIESFRAQQQGLKGVAETREVYPEQKREKPVDLLTVYRLLADAIQNGWADRLPQHLVQMIENAQKIAEEKRFFHWELEFPEVFFDRFGGLLKEKAGFDVVVGNPPYHARLDKFESSFLDEHVNRSRNGRLDTAALFVEAGLLSTKGVLAFLLPYRLISRRRDFGNFQVYLYHRSLIREIDYIGPIEEIDVSDEFMLGFFANARTEQEGQANVIKIGLDVPREHFEEGIVQHYAIPQKAWGPPNYTLNIRLALFDHDVLSKIERESIALGEIAESRDGIVPFIRDRLVATKRLDSRYKPLLGIAGHYVLDRYEVEWDGDTWICYDFEEAKKYISDPKELRKVQLRDESIFLQRCKIITRQDSTTIRGTLDTDQFYHTNSIHSTFLKQDDRRYSLLYVLSLLNSSLVNYCHSSLSLKGPDLHPQVLVTNIPKLPIRRISFTTSTDERARLVKAGIAEATEWIEGTAGTSVSSVSFSAFSGSNLGRWLDARLTADPEQSDVVHDLLAHLAEQMIEMNKEKQAETRGFLDWLADYTGLPVEDWTLKTSLKAYYEQEWAEMRRVLDRNSRKIAKVNVKGREASGLIRDEWETSVEKLRPLLACIAATDRLIDLIVYRLYGLMEEEVAMVEGKS